MYWSNNQELSMSEYDRIPSLEGLKLGPMIKRARCLRVGLSQLELAERVGCSKSTISNWETGRVQPPLRSLKRIFEELEFCGDERRWAFASIGTRND